MRGITALRGRHVDNFDGLATLLISVIELARVDASGRVVAGTFSDDAKAYWQRDAQLFLSALDEVKADILRR